MKKFTFSFKSLLVAAGLLLGSANAWAGVKSTIYEKAVEDWSASDIVTTETAGKWLTSTSGDGNRGLFIVADKGLMTRTRGNTNIDTGTLLLSRTANTIVTLDAVWNVGDSDKSGSHQQGYNQYCSIQYGDLLVKCCLDTRSADYSYTIKGVKTSLGAAAGTLLNTDLTIHIVVNSITNEISEFYIKNGATTLAQFSDLTDANNAFTSGTNYDKVITKSDISGVSSTNDFNYLKSITVQQETQTVYSYTVNAKKSGTLIKQIASGKYLVGDDAIRVAYPQNILKGNTLYSIAMRGSDPRFATSFTPDEDNYSVDLSYDVTPVTDVIYYTEAENITGVSSCSNVNYASLDKMGYTWNGVGDEVYKEVLTLPAGKYKIYARGVNGNGSDRTCHFKVGTEVKWTFSITQSNSNVTGNSEEFTVAAPTTLYFSCVGSSASGCDWFYIKGTVDEGTNVTGLIENADMETAGSGSGFQEVVKGWNNTDNVVNYRRLTNSSVTNNPSGAFTNTYSFENWSNAVGGLTGQMSQTINGLPNGVYKLQLAALVRTVNGQFVYGKSNGKTYKTTLSGANETANDYEVIVVVEDNQLEIGLDMNNSGADWAAIDNARLIYMPTVPATISAAGYATFSSPYPLDLTTANTPAGLTAYYINSTELSKNNAPFTTIDQTVAAGQGILLKGAANTYNIKVAASGTTLPDNALVATDGSAILEGNYVFAYVTASPSTTAGFYYVSADTDPVAAGKAYLNGSLVPSSVKSFIFGDDTATGVEAPVAAEAEEDGVYYNLNGQQVTKDYKGIIIVNGKKFFNK